MDPTGDDWRSTSFYHLSRTTNELVIDERTGAPCRQVYETDGEGHSYGLEFMLPRKLADGFYGWVSYTLSWSDRFVGDDATVPFAFDQRHNLYVAASYSWEGWRFGARFTLSNGRPDRPIVEFLDRSCAKTRMPTSRKRRRDIEHR